MRFTGFIMAVVGDGAAELGVPLNAPQAACAAEIRSAAERASAHWAQVRSLLEDAAVTASQREGGNRRPEVATFAAGRRDAALQEVLETVRELKESVGSLKSDLVAVKDRLAVLRMITDAFCHDVSEAHRKIIAKLCEDRP